MLKIDFPANFSSSFIVSSIISCFIPIFESTSCVSSFLVTASTPKLTTKNKIIDNILFFISLTPIFYFIIQVLYLFPSDLKKMKVLLKDSLTQILYMLKTELLQSHIFQSDYRNPLPLFQLSNK